MHRPLHATLVGCLAAASIAIGGATASQAQIVKFNWGNGDLKFKLLPNCLDDKPRASHYSVRQNARAAGYRHVRAIAYHGRKFNAAHRCGFYRAIAARGNRQFALYFDADSGNLISVRVIGRGGAQPQRLSEQQIERRLARQGWNRIRNIRFVDRGNDDFYVVRARKAGVVYRVWIDASSGKVERTKRLTPEHASKQDVRRTLRHHGYAKIRNLRFVDRGAKEYWVSHASKGGHDYRVFAEADTGKPYRRVRLDNDRASAADVRHSLRAAGYRKIQNLHFVDRGKRELYVALAMRGGRQYRVWLDAEDAEIRRAKRVN
jgi:hypothetical protein